MSVFAACSHKSEWVCSECARCPTCCTCPGELTPVHINTKEAAMALAKWARITREKMLKSRENGT